MSGSTQFINGVYASDHSQVVAGTVHGSVYFGHLNDVLNGLPTAEDAPFNAYQRQHDPTCLHNTRVDLLRKIYNWADSEDLPPIFWLNGLAGTGKTTVAQTVAAQYHAQGRLAASFFFSRDGGEGGHRRNAKRFVTTIAVQLANNVQTTRQTICDAISAHSHIAHQALREQWRLLVLGPLSSLRGDNSARQYVLVIDALDECEDENDIRTILQLLAEIQSSVEVRLRVFLTSRPEVPIRGSFAHMPDASHQRFVLHNIAATVVEHDIRIFLEHNLTHCA